MSQMFESFMNGNVPAAARAQPIALDELMRTEVQPGELVLRAVANPQRPGAVGQRKAVGAAGEGLGRHAALDLDPGDIRPMLYP